MRRPSRTLSTHLSKMVGEADYLAGVKKDMALGELVTQGMDSQFGALLYKTLEELERANYQEIVSVSPWNIRKHLQIRSELKTVQYIKSRLESYVVNAEALLKSLEELADEVA